MGTTACQDTRCDGSEATYGLTPGEGSLVDDETWQSTPLSGPWLEFGPERVWTFDLRGVAGPREILEVLAYVSEAEEPNGGDAAPRGRASFAVAGGNLAVMRLVEPGVFTVRNATCARYFVRVTARLGPASGGDGDGDGG